MTRVRKCRIASDAGADWSEKGIRNFESKRFSGGDRLFIFRASSYASVSGCQNSQKRDIECCLKILGPAHTPVEKLNEKSHQDAKEQTECETPPNDQWLIWKCRRLWHRSVAERRQASVG